MFDVFRLACLDYLIWLRSGKDAALNLNCNQATVSRNAKYVADFLDLDSCKLEGEWSLSGDLSLLSAERKVHQLYRWSHGNSLRIDVVYGVGSPYLNDIHQPWVCGMSNFMNTVYPMALLRESILDVWLGCYPDIPSDDDEFCVIDLVRYPAYFLVDRSHPLLEIKGDLTLHDLRRFPVLSLPDGAFPSIQKHLKGLGLNRSNVASVRHEISRWEGRTEDQLTISYASSHTIKNFNGSKVPLSISTDLTLGDSVVVRRCFANTDYFKQLLSYLRKCTQSLAASFDDVECCPDPFE